MKKNEWQWPAHLIMCDLTITDDCFKAIREWQVKNSDKREFLFEYGKLVFPDNTEWYMFDIFDEASFQKILIDHGTIGDVAFYTSGVAWGYRFTGKGLVSLSCGKEFEDVPSRSDVEPHWKLTPC